MIIAVDVDRMEHMSVRSMFKGVSNGTIKDDVRGRGK